MKNHNRVSKLKKIKKFRPVILTIIFIISFIIPAIATRFGWFGIGEEASVGVFSVVATAVGAIFVVFELNDSERINRCDMLSNLNTNFIENQRFLLLYQELTKCAQDEDYKLNINNDDPNAIHSGDLMGYMTFYEVLNEYVDQGVLDIQQMDDLFGDRFFKLIHNDYIQEHELYAEPSSYVNIFELYSKWKNYRDDSTQKNENRLVVLSKNLIPKLYIDKKLYLRESMQIFGNKNNIPFSNSKGETINLDLHRLLPKNLNQVLNIQNQITGLINHEIFQPSSDEEILESMLLDYCYGLFDGKKLVAVCIAVLNRQTALSKKESERNLCIYTDAKTNYHDYVSFDSIQVLPDYRGFGFQRFFLQEVEKIAQQANAKYVIATVSPKNKYSKEKFDDASYELVKEFPIYQSTRCLMQKHIENCGRML